MSGWAVKRIADLEQELADQKAITELAVKGLKEITEYPNGNALVYVRAMKDKADSTLSDMQRLQNEQI